MTEEMVWDNMNRILHQNNFTVHHIYNILLFQILFLWCHNGAQYVKNALSILSLEIYAISEQWTCVQSSTWYNACIILSTHPAAHIFSVCVRSVDQTACKIILLIRINNYKLTYNQAVADFLKGIPLGIREF